MMTSELFRRLGKGRDPSDNFSVSAVYLALRFGCGFAALCLCVHSTARVGVDWEEMFQVRKTLGRVGASEGIRTLDIHLGKTNLIRRSG